jgi:hypothetical protein
MAGESNAELRDYYEILWHLGGSQTDMASLRAEDIDWPDQTIAYEHMKTGSRAMIRFGDAVAEILEHRPATGFLFPQIVQWKEYELDVLERAGVNVEKDRRFLELSKALVGLLRFDEIAAECKNDALEGREATKSPAARFIWRIMEAVGQKVSTKPTGILLTDGQKLRDLYSR